MIDKSLVPVKLSPPGPPVSVVAAAVHYNGITHSMPAPARHGDIIKRLYPINGVIAIECEQGFLLSDGRFATRLAAKALVHRTGQQTIRDTHPAQLFSEDLW